MGKGDIKTRRGKIIRGTYGKTRPRKTQTAVVAAPPPPKPAKAVKKTPAKK